MTKTFNHQLLLSALRAPLDIGSLWPSSASLAASIVDASNFRPNENIIELGAGTGVITHAIASRLPLNSTFSAVEKCPTLANIARERVKGSAEIIQADFSHINQGSLGRIDCFISSLPMTLWKTHVQESIIARVHSHLSEDGRMTFFCYLTSSIFGRKRALFEILLNYFPIIHEYKIIWKNTPPAKIYVCSKR